MTAPIEIITVPIVISHQLDPQTALQRLRAADEALRAAKTWLKPEAITIEWGETTASIGGRAFGFPVTGEIETTDTNATITLHVPWTAKALLANFRPQVETRLAQILA